MASARTWEVHPDGSGDAPTICAAVDSSADGDTILLGNGVFQGPGNREIDLGSLHITLLSEDRDPELCIIDCEEAGWGILWMGEGTLEGFTVRNGYAELSGIAGGIRTGGLGEREIRNCRIERCVSECRSGGVHATDGIFRLEDCEFFGCRGDPAALWVSGHAHARIVRCQVCSCTANVSSCAVLADEYSVSEWEDVDVISCVRTGLSLGNGDDSRATFTRCNVRDCTWTGLEMVGYVWARLYDREISQNRGNSGGGVYVYTDWGSPSSPAVVMERCKIFDNHSGIWGGAIYLDLGYVRLEECLVEGNTAGYGGGIYAFQGVLDLPGTKVRGNWAGYRGGGIFIDSRCPVRDGVVTGNQAGWWGGGVFSDSYEAELTRCTIAGNHSIRGGGGLYVPWPGSTTICLDNCLIWGNRSDSGGDQAWLGEGNQAIFNCCDIDSSGILGPPVTWESGNLFTDPLFCDPRSPDEAPTIEGDYSLQDCSPCANSPECGLIGALGVGCSGTATHQTSWGAVKKLFR